MWRLARHLRRLFARWADPAARLGDMERRRNLGRAIRRARVWRELTQAELALALGVGERTVGRWEAGEAEPSLLMLGPLCTALGVSAEYLRRAPDEDVDRLL